MGALIKLTKTVVVAALLNDVVKRAAVAMITKPIWMIMRPTTVSTAGLLLATLVRSIRGNHGRKCKVTYGHTVTINEK